MNRNTTTTDLKPQLQEPYLSNNDGPIDMNIGRTLEGIIHFRDGQNTFSEAGWALASRTSTRSSCIEICSACLCYSSTKTKEKTPPLWSEEPWSASTRYAVASSAAPCFLRLHCHSTAVAPPCLRAVKEFSWRLHHHPSSCGRCWIYVRLSKTRFPMATTFLIGRCQRGWCHRWY